MRRMPAHRGSLWPHRSARGLGARASLHLYKASVPPSAPSVPYVVFSNRFSTGGRRTGLQVERLLFSPQASRHMTAATSTPHGDLQRAVSSHRSLNIRSTIERSMSRGRRESGDTHPRAPRRLSRALGSPRPRPTSARSHRTARRGQARARVSHISRSAPTHGGHSIIYLHRQCLSPAFALTSTGRACHMLITWSCSRVADC
jgi:hypothetical protein